MQTLYFEDGSREYIINPRFDFRRVIEDRLGKDSADFFDELIEDIEIESQTHADTVLNEIENDLRTAISRVKNEDSSFDTLDFLQEIFNKIIGI